MSHSLKYRSAYFYRERGHAKAGAELFLRLANNVMAAHPHEFEKIPDEKHNMQHSGGSTGVGLPQTYYVHYAHYAH